MARADLLINLVRAGAQGDQVGFRRTVEAIVAEERERQHHVVADRLQEFLRLSARGEPAVPEGVGSLLHEVHPRRLLEDLILPDEVATACRELLEEHRRVDLLRAYDLEPRHRALLSGPPGNGKTSLAEAIAGELAIPLLVVRYDAVVASFLGETAARLARMFDYVRGRRCVLFFDEFDAIGKERGDEHETGEIKRVVSSLLLNIDALPPHVIVVAATNHAELLDRAVWRRFQLRAELPPPTLLDLQTWLSRFESSTGRQLAPALKRSITQGLRGHSFAELEDFFRDIQRRLVLDGPSADLTGAVQTRLVQWRGRAGVATKKAKAAAKRSR